MSQELPTYDELVKQLQVSEAAALRRKHIERDLEQELKKFKVLYELAIAMTDDHLLDDNLQLVVEKSRELLNADTAYIALRDEARGHVYMKSLSGIRTEAFKKMHLPIGKGLGGLVAKTRKGYIVENYFQEKKISRFVDQIVEEEGLISGMAVPVQMGHENLGVLYVFNRNPTRFSRSDLDTLFLIGNLAAVEIARKRTDAALRRARSDLEKRVEERTSQLLNSNVQLKSEVEERKRMEEALRESEEKYRLVVSNARDCIFIAQDGVIKFPNPPTVNLTGYSAEELAATPFTNLIHPDYRELVVERHKKRLAGEEPPALYAYPIITKHGEQRWVELSTAAIQWEGRPATLNFVRDMTEQKRLEAQLKHAQKLESIGIMAGGVAHNFRNILTVISTNAQLLQTQCQDDPSMVSLTERINNAVKKGAHLVDGLMLFSRKKEMDKHEVLNAAHLIKETHDLIRKSFDKKIEIQVRHPAFLPVLGDYTGLSQVLLNICINARDAMPDGGKLLIEAEQAENRVVLAVSDTGEGMDKRTREKCFDPFFTTKALGTGLGLSTSYGIVRNHGGDIRVRSEIGDGTTFEILLPQAPHGTVDAPATTPEIMEGRGQKILLVDDEIDMLEATAKLLESIGYRVTTSDNGQDAIAQYETWQPDAALIDRNMPHMDGIACAEEIKKQDPAARILIISGYDETGPYGIAPEAQDLIWDYITKPIDIPELSVILARLFDTAKGGEGD